MDRQYSSLVGQAGGVRYSSYDVAGELKKAGWKPAPAATQPGQLLYTSEIPQVQSYSPHVVGTVPAVASQVMPTQVVEPTLSWYTTPSYRTPFPAPQKIVQERVHEVRKPYVVERVIEVPKPEIRHVTRYAKPEIVEQEQIIEVPQAIEEENIIRIPRKEIQERLIEVPKIDWVETLEYEDRIEYREVLVDKIIEVPEIEYRVNQVEKLVPQQFIEEYFVDNYKEVPMTEVQEVERTEYAPVTQMPFVHAPKVDAAPVPVATTISPPVPLSGNLSTIFSQYATVVPSSAAPRVVQAPRAVPVGGVGSIKVVAPVMQQSSYASYNPLAAGPKLLTPPTPPAASYSPVVPSTLPSAYVSPAAATGAPTLVSVF